mgnify:CR=1 FL=1
MGPLRPPPFAYAILVKEVRLEIMDLTLAIILIVVGIVVGLAAGFGIGIAYRKKVAEREIGSAEADGAYSAYGSGGILRACSSRRNRLLRQDIHPRGSI